MSNLRERIYIKKNILIEKERDLLDARHIERYAMIRQWCHGVVYDAACGCGYGSYMIGMNPDVDFVLGFDIDKSAIDHAKSEFSCKRVSFNCMSLDKIKKANVDVLVSLETIEHIKNPLIYSSMISNIKPKEIILSFPSKKTTHYNPHHFHDFKTLDILNLLVEYKLKEEIVLNHELTILRLVINE